MIGRGTRLYPGKQNCLILDVVGVSTKHRLQTVATLFDLNPVLLTQESVLEAIEAQQQQRHEVMAPTGELVARAVDLFARRPLAWVQTQRGTWILSLAQQGTLRLVPDGKDTWRVLHQRSALETVVVRQGLPLGYAQGTAEDLARSLGATGLLDPQASWRREPATDRQKAALRKCRIPFSSALTKGEAGTLLSQVLGDLPPRYTEESPPRLKVGGRVVG